MFKRGKIILVQGVPKQSTEVGLSFGSLEEVVSI